MTRKPDRYLAKLVILLAATAIIIAAGAIAALRGSWLAWLCLAAETGLLVYAVVDTSWGKGRPG